MRIILFFLLLASSQLIHAQTNRVDPYKNFKFRVLFNSTESTLHFSDVSGLGIDLDIAEYRSGEAPGAVRKMPGMRKYGNITLKRGTFAHSPRLTNYFKAVSAGKVNKETIKILMVDDTGKVHLSWTLINAYPMKYRGANLNASGTEVAMEELVLSHEGLRWVD